MDALIFFGVVVVLPVLVGSLGGLRVKAGPGYRQAPVVAWICALAVSAAVVVMVDGDKSDGVEIAFLSVLFFPLTLGGVAAARRIAHPSGG